MATINCLIHPHHVSFQKHYTSLHTLHQHREDPYYGLDHRPSHAGVSVPHFDVREGDSAFYLEGEVPGVLHLGDIIVEFVENQTLIVRGTVKPKVLFEETEVKSETAPGTEGASAKTDVVGVKHSEKDLKWKLKERHVGPFERSFTFPVLIKSDAIETALEGGILSIVVPKDEKETAQAEAHREIESEI